MIPVHRAVLALHSDVFGAMFDPRNANEMSENKTGEIRFLFPVLASIVVSIVDFDYETIETLVAYVYSGEEPHVSKITTLLLRCADKYNMSHLKVAASIITWHNAGDLHHASWRESYRYECRRLLHRVE